jgi:hypothetical protein
MPFRLDFTPEASRQLAALALDSGLSKRLKAVRKALALLEQNPNHPGLNAHQWRGESCPHNGQLFEAYAENNTPGA